jgi:Flp pilus assembly protein TadD
MNRSRARAHHTTAVLITVAFLLLVAAVSERAIELRNLGIAQLENEKPSEASDTFAELTRAAGDEPLSWGNLAIARLRLQETEAAREAIQRALDIAPGDPKLLAIRGDIEQWEGDQATALQTYLEAARKAPDDVEVQYALHRLASAMTGDEAGVAIDLALGNLSRLRPDNLVVMLQLGQRAVARGDRAEATRAYLRVRELLWQAPPIAERALDMLLTALESDQEGAARTPAQRLTNVLVVTPGYQQGLRELTTGIQGVPILEFGDEPPTHQFGDPLDVSFSGESIAQTPVSGRALTVGDFDGDQTTDLVWIDADGQILVKLAASHAVSAVGSAPTGATRLVTFDLDNDGVLDLLVYGAGPVAFWQGQPGGGFSEATEAFGLSEEAGTAAAALDFDIEGDLDLVAAGGSTQSRLYRNALVGALEDVGPKSLPQLPSAKVRDIAVADLDRDGDLDLLFAHDEGLSWLDNLRQGEFADRSQHLGPARGARAEAITAVDLDNDGLPDLVAAGDGIRLFHNLGSGFAAWDLGESLSTNATFHAVAPIDADNDGRLDLAIAGPSGLAVAAQRDGAFRFLPVQGGPPQPGALAVSDLDLDGDLDLIAGGPTGLVQLTNEGGNGNHWLSLRLRGLTKGNSKNNILGLGTSIEVRDGLAYQFHEAQGDVVHLGLGSRPAAKVVRVTWTNGVPQNRLDLATNQTIVEEQLLKGSCPFVYAWDGEQIAFVTDLLWGAPLGLPLAPNVWTSSDPSELVHLPQAHSSGGRYDLRITEELWEAAFFDKLRLWVVDYPQDLEIASNLRVEPGRQLPERVLATRALRPLAAAWDGEGNEVTRQVADRDEIYADGFAVSPYQGVAGDLWSFTLDLGEAPGAPIRLHLDGWIFPADASLNLAVAQRDDLGNPPPRLEVETETGWQALMPSMGFPAGKTKTMVVDTPPLPDGARRLRIVTGQWLSWDRIAWSTAPADEDLRIVAKLSPASADLRYRGFSRLVRQAPNAPHTFDYAESTELSPWLPFPGAYTRFGDVRELLDEADDRTVVMAPGDEMRVLFDASALPEPPEGWRRAVFLESHGWDKDADRNTGEGLRVEPLPFRAMSAYPYGPGEKYPAHLQTYVEEWQTRRVNGDLRLQADSSVGGRRSSVD